ncbi:MAG TPA: RICIN domain-containing protein [Polyangiaceae bacterium]
MMLAAGVGMLGVACGGAMEGDEVDAMLDTESSAIVNGSVLSAAQVQDSGLVAIYHPKLPSFTWYPRPCSGVVIRSYAPPFSTVGVVTWVLTARHCVTTDGGIWGPLASPNQLRLIPSTNPGPAAPNPPAAAVTPVSVTDLGGLAGDTAIVTLLVDWSAIASRRLGLFVGKSSSLVGKSLTAFGYGINPNDPSCSTNNTSVGAGIARSGGAFPVVSSSEYFGGQSASYSYTNSNSAGQSVVCGDSGGPDQLLTLNGMRYVLGIHSGPDGGTMRSDVINKALLDTIGGLFLSPSNNRSFDLAVDANNNIIFVANGDLRRAWTKYDAATRQLVMSGSCVGTVTNAAGQLVPKVMPCNSADPWQKWDFNASFQLKSVQNGQCWTSPSAGQLTLSACTSGWFGPSASQQWLFSAQP